MSLQSHVQDLFTTIPAITNLVGAGSAARIFPVEAPQGTQLPYIVLTQVSAPRGHHLRGPDGHAQVRLQIDYYAATVTELKADDGTTGLCKAGRKALDCYKGRRKGTAIRSSIIFNERDFPADELKGFRVMQEFSIWIKED